MERIDYWDPRCGMYLTADNNSLDLFPAELTQAANFTASNRVNVINSWNGMYDMDVNDAGNKWNITIDEMAAFPDSKKYSVAVEVKKTAAVHIYIGQNAITVDVIKMPKLLNDKVAWALGAKKWQKAKSHKELEEYFTVHDIKNEQLLESGEIQPGPCYAALRYNYGHCHAVVLTDGYGEPYDGKYYINGFLARDEAVEILKKAIQLDGWFFSYPAKIQYVLDNI